MVEMRLGDVPESFIEGVSHRLENYSVGFAKLEEGPDGEDPTLGASGTLVEVEGIRAILTASHVISRLPSSGTLGLILTGDIQRHTIEVGGHNGAKYRHIGEYRENTEREGPDLGAIILPPEVASSIGAIKSFFDLTRCRDRMLNNPPGVDDGLWFLQGFLAYRTIDRGAVQGFLRVKEFGAFTSWGGRVENAAGAAPFDYFTYPVTHGPGSAAPVNYRGTSGGGLWQVLGDVSAASGELSPTEHLLSGVAFYQDWFRGKPSAVRCHGRRSIYDIAYKDILRSIV